MLENLHQIDEALFLWMHHLIRGEAINEVMWMISDRWIWLPMYLALFVWLWRRFGWKTTLLACIAIAFGVLCADQVCAGIIRPLVERLRPSHPDNPLSESVYLVNNYRGASYGFPSCHAANTFMLASFITFFAPKYKSLVIWMFTWALLNCISRIYLGVHYPGDVLFGGIIGSGFGVFWAYVTKLIIQKPWMRKIMSKSVLDVKNHFTIFSMHFPKSARFNAVIVIGIITLVVIISLAIINQM